MLGGWEARSEVQRSEGGDRRSGKDRDQTSEVGSQRKPEDRGRRTARAGGQTTAKEAWSGEHGAWGREAGKRGSGKKPEVRGRRSEVGKGCHPPEASLASEGKPSGRRYAKGQKPSILRHLRDNNIIWSDPKSLT